MARIAHEKMARLDDARALVRQLYRSEVDLIPDHITNTLTVRLHHLQAGADCLRLSEWLEPLGAELREAKESLCCARSLANVMR
jgi:hypothetical protein